MGSNPLCFPKKRGGVYKIIQHNNKVYHFFYNNSMEKMKQNLECR